MGGGKEKIQKEKDRKIGDEWNVVNIMKGKEMSERGGYRLV